MKETRVSKESIDTPPPSLVESEIKPISDGSVWGNKSQKGINYLYVLASFIATLLGGRRFLKYPTDTLASQRLKEGKVQTRRKINEFDLEHKNEDLSELFFTEDGQEAWYETLENVELSELFYTPEGESAWYLDAKSPDEPEEKLLVQQPVIKQQVVDVDKSALFIMDDAAVIESAHQQDFELSIAEYEEKEGKLLENKELSALNQQAFNGIGPYINLAFARKIALFSENQPIDSGMDAQQCNELHRELVHRVLRQPKYIVLHLHRIYFCYHHALSEPLYAALVDLLLILDSKGKHFSRRLVLESAEGLSKPRLKILLNYLKQANDLHVFGNSFSVFTKGFLSTKSLISLTDTSQVEYDVLNLARDYVEYGQLEQALEVLESSLLEMPDRFDIQNELLELYVITRNKVAYIKMTHQLTECQLNISIEWQNSAQYFAGLNNEQ